MVLFLSKPRTPSAFEPPSDGPQRYNWWILAQWSVLRTRELCLIVRPAAMLYMLEITQLVYYFRHFHKRDGFLLKGLVILCFLIDTLCTIAICGWVFLVRPSFDLT
jgi:hypothetical protein